MRGFMWSLAKRKFKEEFVKWHDCYFYLFDIIDYNSLLFFLQGYVSEQLFKYI